MIVMNTKTRQSESALPLPLIVALYRKQSLETIDVFDEAFVAYQEDVDIGFRAQLAGYRCLCVPKAIVYHKYQMTSSRVSSLRIYLNERNKYFVLIKNLPTRLIRFCLPLVALHEGLCFIEALRRGYRGIYFKALKDVWGHFPQMLRERPRIRTIQTVDDRYRGRIMSFKEPVRIFFHSRAAALSLRESGHATARDFPLSRFLSAGLGEKS